MLQLLDFQTGHRK